MTNCSNITCSDLITAGITIFIFFAGYFLNVLIERYKSNKQLNDIEIYFWEIIELLEIQIKSQLELNSNCISRLKDPFQLDVSLGKTSGQQIRSINKLDEKDLFKIFINRKIGEKKEKSIIFQRFLQNIDYFEEAIPDLFKTNGKTTELIEEYRNIWNESHRQSMTLYNSFNQFNLLNNIPKEQDKFLSELNMIVRSYKENFGNEGFKMKNGLDHFVERMINTCIKYSNDPRGVQLLAIVQDSKEAFNEIENAKRNFRIILIDYTRHLNRALIDHKLNKEKIQSLKTKKTYVA